MDRAAWCDELVVRIRAGRSVLVTGPAGIGKTTMLREVASRLSSDGRTVSLAVASPMAGRIPMGALAPLVPVAAVSLPESTQRIAAVAAWFAAAADDADPTGRTAPVLVIDEADHLDDESAIVVHHLVTRGSTRVLCAVRSADDAAPPPASLERLVRDGDLDRIRLSPLTDDESERVLGRRLGGVVAAETVRVLHAAAEGNPLQLEQLVQHNLDVGRIVRRGGVWAGADLEPTTTIVELLRSRLGAIEPTTLRALRLAALAGPVHESVLVDVAGADAVADAVRRDLLVVSRSDVLAIAHPMVAETIVSMCGPAEQVELLEAAVDSLLSAPEAGADWSVPLASWMLALVDRGTIGAERLLDAATRMIADLRPDLGERLVLAAGPEGGERAIALLSRTRAMQGTPTSAATGGASSASALAESAIGGFEAFVLGLADGVVVGAAFEQAIAANDGIVRDELVVLQTAFGMYRGRPVGAAIDALVDATLRHADTPLACIAGVNAIVGLTEVGRFEAAIDIGRVMVRSGSADNAFHDTQQAFSTAESLLRLGRRDAAIALADERLTRGTGVTSPMAMVFGAALSAQVALADGRPDLAAPHFGTVLSAMNGLDAAGIGSWAERGLRLCTVWTGDRAALDVRPRPIPLHGSFQTMVCRLFEVQTLLAGGHRRAAHAAAIELAHDAAHAGHVFAALRSVHLACTVSATRASAEWAGELAARCDGELAAALAEHAVWLATGDGPGLDKAGHAFVALGQAELALDAFRRAEDELRRRGSSAASRRAGAAADALVDSGTRSLAPSSRLAFAHGLTPREVEVAGLAAAGMSSRAIGGRIGLSARTVETHLQRVYTKLDVHDRAGLAALGLGDGADGGAGADDTPTGDRSSSEPGRPRVHRQAGAGPT